MALVIGIGVASRDEIVLGAVRKNELTSLQPKRRQVDISDVQDLRHFLDAPTIRRGIELQSIVGRIARNDVLHGGGTCVVEKRIHSSRRISWHASSTEIGDHESRSLEQRPGCELFRTSDGKSRAIG